MFTRVLLTKYVSGNRTASPSVSSKPAVPAKPTNVLIQNRHELLKKPLRERCIHLLATGKYKSKSDVLDRLKLEGAPKNESMEDFLSAAGKLVKEVIYLLISNAVFGQVYFSHLLFFKC